MNPFIDRVHRLPRIWSNRELAKYADLFHGDVVNVSGWKDIDKQGKKYCDYFCNADSYTITNYKAEARGFQGEEGEIFVDLEQPLDPNLVERFDVVFNHTTLEHICEVRTAFANLCHMSRDVVVIVLPFVQQYHADYWRFSPLAVRRLFEDNGFTLVYQSFNSDFASSVYTFTIASRHAERWQQHFDWSFTVADPKGKGDEAFIGCRALGNWGYKFSRLLRGR